MAPAVPLIEIARNRNRLRIGSPDGKANAAHAFHFGQVSAQRVVTFVVRAFAVQVQLKPA